MVIGAIGSYFPDKVWVIPMNFVSGIPHILKQIAYKITS